MVTTGTFAGLGSRLSTVCECVLPGARVADVGANHGRVAERLVAAGRAAWCVATERRPERIAGLLARIRSGTAPSGVEVRVGDGLSPLAAADRIDTLVLSGLGGRSVVAILDGGPRRLGIRRLVLQPQTEHALVRAWLRDHAFDLVDERIVKDAGESYLVLVAEPGPGESFRPVNGLETDDLLEAGPVLVRRRDPAARAWWSRQEARLAAIVARLPAPRGARARADLARARRILDALEVGDR